MIDHSKNPSMICLGAFAGAQGVHGDAKVKTFTQAAENIAAYGAVVSEDGTRVFTLKFIRLLKPDLALVRAGEIENREDAQQLAGTRLYVAREKLDHDIEEDEFYFEDLMGLEVRLISENQIETQNHNVIGKVGRVHNFGAGDVLELTNIKDHKGVHLVPFTKQAVPHINIADGYIALHPDYLPDDKSSDAEERKREKGD